MKISSSRCRLLVLMSAVAACICACGGNGSNPPPAPTPTPAGDTTACSRVGVEVVSCNAVPIGSFATGFDRNSSEIYGRMTFATAFGQDSTVLKGRDARTFWDALKTTFRVTKVQSVIVSVTPKLGDLQLSQTVVALLDYSDSSGTPEWKSVINRKLETPWRLMSPDETFSYDISYAVSDQRAADIKTDWEKTAAFIPPVGPQVVAVKATIGTLVDAAQPVINAFMSATGAKVDAAIKDSISPLSGEARAISYAFGPASSPTIKLTASAQYRSSMFDGPVDSVSQLSQTTAALDDADQIVLPDGSSALRKAEDDNKQIILAASNQSARTREVVQSACTTVRGYLEDPKQIGLNKLDANLLTAGILHDAPLLVDTIPTVMRKPCIIEVAEEIAKAGAKLPDYDASQSGLLSTGATNDFFKQLKSMQSSDAGAESLDGMNLVKETTLVNLIDGTQTREANQLSLMMELGSLGINYFGCFTVAKAADGSPTNLGRIALAKGPKPEQRYAFEFWGKKTPDVANSVDVDYIVIRKPIDSDFDPKNTNCPKFR